MKKYSALLCVLISAGIGIQSCDKIEAPYREQTNGGIVLGDNAIVVEGDTFTFIADTSQSVQKVFLEEYTGHLCQNCPPAAQTIYNTLHPLYGNQLISIAVHAGEFAETCPTALDCPGNAPAGSFLVDFRTTTGNDWNTSFLVAGYPSGMVNRSGSPSSSSSWGTKIQGMINNVPKTKMRIINHYDAASHKLRMAVETKFLADTSITCKLEVIVVEDSIVDWQRWLPHTPEFVPDYVHRNVLRAGINGSFGSVISTGITAGTIKLNGFSYTLNSGWNASHCKVIAFVYDAGNYKILQVEEADVIQ